MSYFSFIFLPIPYASPLYKIDLSTIQPVSYYIRSKVFDTLILGSTIVPSSFISNSYWYIFNSVYAYDKSFEEISCSVPAKGISAFIVFMAFLQFYYEVVNFWIWFFWTFFPNSKLSLSSVLVNFFIFILFFFWFLFKVSLVVKS